MDRKQERSGNDEHRNKRVLIPSCHSCTECENDLLEFIERVQLINTRQGAYIGRGWWLGQLRRGIIVVLGRHLTFRKNRIATRGGVLVVRPFSPVAWMGWERVHHDMVPHSFLHNKCRLAGQYRASRYSCMPVVGEHVTSCCGGSGQGRKEAVLCFVVLCYRALGVKHFPRLSVVVAIAWLASSKVRRRRGRRRR